MSIELSIDQADEIKLGVVQPRENIAEIWHTTQEGDEVRIGAIMQDPNDPDSQLATLYRHNRITGETTNDHGRIRGNIREAAHYVWEHKTGASAVASLAITVTLGTLWARHKKS
ncbi:hypothetical protein H0V99_02300 [Candidatus Saccharibacteria bacterium]|nr:hypothetical protein [Candidatus Saccharibacteria bacterium]